jgi:hypothetical protein
MKIRYWSLLDHESTAYIDDKDSMFATDKYTNRELRVQLIHGQYREVPLNALEMYQAIQRVRDLHKSDNAEAYLPEYAEGNQRCMECSERYPCATIRALDGEQS